MNNLPVKIALFCWMAGNAFIFALLTMSPVGKIATLAPFLLVLRDLVWPLFSRSSIL